MSKLPLFKYFLTKRKEAKSLSQPSPPPPAETIVKSIGQTTTNKCIRHTDTHSKHSKPFFEGNRSNINAGKGRWIYTLLYRTEFSDNNETSFKCPTDTKHTSSSARPTTCIKPLICWWSQRNHLWTSQLSTSKTKTTQRNSIWSLKLHTQWNSI